MVPAGRTKSGTDPPDFVQQALLSLGPKVFTLVVPIREDDQSVLLGEKKRGFGAGFFNGFGGKVESGESIVEAAQRELQEEACITAHDLHAVGVLTFVFDDNPRPWEVHVFSVRAFDGVPTETEEMRPQWFQQDAIPFHSMWADDVHWYPLLLSGRKFAGLFAFMNTTQLIWHKLQELDSEADVNAPAALPWWRQLGQEGLGQEAGGKPAAAAATAAVQTGAGAAVVAV